MARQIKQFGTSAIVYDDCWVSQIHPDMFSRDYWPNATVVPGYSGGRGATLFVEHAGAEWVLKHFHRGGLVGKFLSDGFFWAGLSRARSVIEWDLLREITTQKLPGPKPIAAHVKRNGLVYRADLLTERIPDVTPLSTRLSDSPAGSAIWRRVGNCIARFHAAGFCHADLTTHNLQIDSADQVYLLDWDRGRQLEPGDWRQQNLDRLQRSCLKISRDDQAHFDVKDWEALISGYTETLNN